MESPLARYVVLLALTAAAGAGMVFLNQRDTSAQDQARGQVTAEVPVAARVMPRVAVAHVEPAPHEVTVRFAGKIRPWETYTIGFEVPGRLMELGTDTEGRPLDEGSRVIEGQILARLDQRVLMARRAEAVAQFEQTASDLRRARQLRDGGLGGITEAEYQQAVTDHALAQAQLEVATKNLEDATLVAPVSGTIARRLAKPGEPVGANQVVFELLEDDQMLLVVDVPERDIASLQNRMRQVEALQETGAATDDPEHSVFRARVALETRDTFGRPFPPIDAEVYRIGPIADARTGLFEVEIKIPNEGRRLRGGMVASAEVVVDRVSAYRIPETAALFTKSKAYLFRVDQQPEPRKVMFWEIDETPLATAEKVELTEWVDLGDYLLIPTTAADLHAVVVRGQQRLADGEHVRIVEQQSLTYASTATSAPDEPAVGVARHAAPPEAPSER